MADNQIITEDKSQVDVSKNTVAVFGYNLNHGNFNRKSLKVSFIKKNLNCIFIILTLYNFLL